MESPEDLQLLEITALQSIYAEDFIECPPPKAWKVCWGSTFAVSYQEYLSVFRVRQDYTNSLSEFPIPILSMRRRLISICT